MMPEEGAVVAIVWTEGMELEPGSCLVFAVSIGVPKMTSEERPIPVCVSEVNLIHHVIPLSVQ